MEAKDIIGKLYCCKEINGLIDKMEPAELREDLRQEFFLILLEKDPKKIVEMHQKGVLKFFAIRTLMNTVKSSTSPYYYQYRKRKHAVLV